MFCTPFWVVTLRVSEACFLPMPHFLANISAVKFDDDETLGPDNALCLWDIDSIVSMSFGVESVSTPYELRSGILEAKVIGFVSVRDVWTELIIAT